MLNRTRLPEFQTVPEFKYLSQFLGSTTSTSTPPPPSTTQAAPVRTTVPSPEQLLGRIRAIPPGRAALHRLQINDEQLGNELGDGGEDVSALEINNDPEYASYEVKHPLLGQPHQDRALKRRFLR